MAGPVTAAYWIRKAAALAGDEKTGNAVGTILTAFLLPFILVIVCLCGMMDAAADHNRAAVEWCFGDGAIPAAAPEEYAGHITQMRMCFAVLDGAVGKLNAELEEGSVPLRANRVKADFFALNFGAPDLTLRQGQAESFAGCYVSEAVRIRTVEVPNPEYDPPEDEEELEDYDVPKTIEVEQEYMVTVPFPVSWTVKMKKKQKETQDILSYHTQAAGCSDKARAKASGGRQPIEECGRTGL